MILHINQNSLILNIELNWITSTLANIFTTLVQVEARVSETTVSDWKGKYFFIDRDSASILFGLELRSNYMLKSLISLKFLFNKSKIKAKIVNYYSKSLKAWAVESATASAALIEAKLHFVILLGKIMQY